MEKRAANHGKRKNRQQYEKLAQLLTDGEPVTQALRTAGWSENSALRGWDSVPGAVEKLLPPRAKKLMHLGKMDKDARRDLVRGRLVQNMISGKDGGSMSAKIAGSDSELNMWEPEFKAGLIILNSPAIPESMLQEPPPIESKQEAKP